MTLSFSLTLSLFFQSTYIDSDPHILSENDGDECSSVSFPASEKFDFLWLINPKLFTISASREDPISQHEGALFNQMTCL